MLSDCCIPLYLESIRFCSRSRIRKQISTSDGFEVNYSFTNRRKKIKILLPSDDEKKKGIETVDMSSNHRISTLIVRIMKSKKSLHYQELINECIEQHGGMFKIEGEAFKKIIENLITQDYIERDEQDINILRYVTWWKITQRKEGYGANRI